MPSASASACFRRVRIIKFDKGYIRGEGDLFLAYVVRWRKVRANTIGHLSEPDAMAEAIVPPRAEFRPSPRSWPKRMRTQPAI